MRGSRSGREKIPRPESLNREKRQGQATHRMSHRTQFRNARFTLAILVVAFTGLTQALLAQEITKSATSAELDQLLVSKDSGLLTDWRLVGPFGKTADFRHAWAPERDHLKKSRYGADRVLSFEFVTGKFELPAAAAHKPKGIYYASSEVWLPNGGDWRLYAETAGEMIVFLDGKPIIHRSGKNHDLQTSSEVVHLAHGTHRVLVKFNAVAAPFHLAVMPETGGLPKHNNIPKLHLTPESQYTSAALHWPK